MKPIMNLDEIAFDDVEESRTFWAPGFGVVTDKYGVPWEINAEEAEIST